MSEMSRWILWKIPQKIRVLKWRRKNLLEEDNLLVTNTPGKATNVQVF